MVCLQQSLTSATKIKQTPQTAKEADTEFEMDFEGVDKLQLQHLSGCDIVTHPPMYSPDGEFLFFRCNTMVQVYSTTTGELTRQLLGAAKSLISMELELEDRNILVACTAAGEVLRWDWRTGQLENKLQTNLSIDELYTCNLINFYNDSKTACAFVTGKNAGENFFRWCVVDTGTGEKVKKVCHLKLMNFKPLIAVANKQFPTMVIVQSCYVFFLDYKNWKWCRLFNAHKVPMTVVRFHPKEETLATGDEKGKIFLWRHFMSQQTVKTSLYHWHHTSVTSIAFTASGSSFYSSGLESVLVKWNVKKPELRNFIPRMSATIKHITISEDNTQLAVCTADNGVQIVGADNKIKSTMQEFTYIIDDKTQKCKFPIGLRLNPRTNTLVLNGRIGHLQFYSAYSKRLLYNMDIVGQNQLSMESGKILYNIRIVKAAFNIDWMATGEVFNDEEHLPELRLKFWKYEEKSQSYVLNTNVELPHEGGFKAIEFSNDYQVDNLLCATVGEDNIIKIWCLEESDNIYKKGKVWFCIAQTNYKNMPLESISFSQDGSLLAAGFGNTLCIYKADTLRLKAALTSTTGLDGCVQKAQIRVAKKSVNGSKNELSEQRKKLMQLFTNLLDNNDESLIKELKKSLHTNKSKSQPNRGGESSQSIEIDEKQKVQAYKKILHMHELNLFQKLQILQRLGIRCEVHPNWQTKMAAYLRQTVSGSGLTSKMNKLQDQVHRLNVRDRFKAKYRLHQSGTRLKAYDAEITQHLVPIMGMLNLADTTEQPQLTNGLSDMEHQMTTETQDKMETDGDEKSDQSSRRTVRLVPAAAQISRVQFAGGEYAHLIVVCTERRVLIWNLLTLRLQSILKLSVEHLAFDAQTNLVAAFTRSNELHVFQPNVPLPIYQRCNMPKIHGVIWLPRRHPKQRSINIDWQAQSTLYFLTENQDVMFLGSEDSLDADAPSPISFTNPASEGLRYSTFGTFAIQQHTDKRIDSLRQQMGPLVAGNSGKTAVKSLIEMSTHTMPPLSLLCNDFVKSLVKAVNSSASEDNADIATSRENGRRKTKGASDEDGDVLMNGNVSYSKRSEESESDADDYDDYDDRLGVEVEERQSEQLKDNMEMRRKLLDKTQEVSSKKWTTPAQPLESAESLLKRVVEQNFELEF